MYMYKRVKGYMVDNMILNWTKRLRKVVEYLIVR